MASMSPIGRVMAIDLGKRHVGVAKSDSMRVITQPHATLDRNKGDLVENIAALCEELEVGEIVIGLPLHMDGREGEGAADARAFAAAIEARTQLKVILWDERLTTTSAHKHMTAMGVKTKNKKGMVDQLAAELILQGYLDSRR
jgi:putative Holliday junction resolvase